MTKENYLTENEKEAVLMNFEKEIAKYTRPRELKLADSCALLILDMQEYFCSSRSHAFVPAALSIIPKIKELAILFEKAGLPVISTKHINDEDNAGLMSEWWREIIRKENPAAEIVPLLKFDFAYTLEKSQYDAFFRTELEDILHENVCSTVIICGVMTHLCCETTARSAFMRGFNVIFPIDSTASYNSDFHRNSLVSLAHGFALTPRIQQVIDQLETGK